jgi:hypothetical protein
MRKLILLGLILSIMSCSSFYGTNSYTYLNILPDSTNFKSSYIEFYIDSVLNKHVVIPDSIKSQFYISSEQKDLFEEDRLVYFTSYPDEWYLIAFDANPCWIKMVYTKRLNKDYPIANPSLLSKSELLRVKKRFQTEILDGARLYAKRNYIPDSIVYLR